MIQASANRRGAAPSTPCASGGFTSASDVTPDTSINRVAPCPLRRRVLPDNVARFMMCHAEIARPPKGNATHTIYSAEKPEGLRAASVEGGLYRKGSDQAFVLGVESQLQASVHVELFVDMVQVNLDRAFADGQFVSDLLVMQPAGN